MTSVEEPWLPGRLPDGWRITQMRRIATFRNGSDYKDVEVSTGGYPVYGSGGEFRRAGHYLYDGDSVLFGRKGTIDKPLLVSGRFWTVDTMFFTELKAGVEPRFLHYYATTMPFDYYSTSTALPSMTQGQLGGHRLPLPPTPEQHAIADFLDRETARIDTLIEEQKRLVELLQERRQTLLEHCVTRGLNRQTPLKPSTLNWIESVPDHWTVANIRRFATMKTGHTPSRSVPEYWDDCDIPWFTLADVWQLRDSTQTYLGSTSNLISKLGLENSAAELLPAGTVVLSRTASVGFTGIMPTAMATSQDYWNWVCGPNLLPEYLVYVFRAMRSEFQALMIGSTHQTIYQPIAAAIRIPVPPIDEQRSIAAYLDEQTSKIDMLIAETKVFVELSRERRTALITAAVTGQIDVRNEVA
ncbi:restriction endonuclease S subunit [Mycobacteroides abscessus subsp. abscessus]|nr:restriction endonuclease subunit S [Mycobacteroides abscessus]SKU22836.1 restriction endonuclease S subunit [Mycobacteroides abscessus subsp. abscessus]